ncbi:MAG: hypothetical protein HFJ28_02075 [Clostridia bacterium]|nr:hypothetical protein [Clostridia bacterium]
MGGPTYDRDVYGSSSSSGWGSSFGASSYSAEKMSSSLLHSSMLPNGKTIESKTKNPIIIMLDVTGSNIDFARVVYDKMPMFYGQIEQKGYLEDFDIAFCAVGDAYSDKYPLQIGDFAKGIELDSWLEKIVLEGNGGGQRRESYELAAYYLCCNAKFAPGSNPIVFFIGDEMPYAKVSEHQAEKFDLPKPEGGYQPFRQLREKVNDNVFMLLNKYNGRQFEDDITSCWTKLLVPEHVVRISEEKAIVDLMLGIISMVSNTRSLDTYKIDMLDRGQTQKRIEGVTNSLKNLSTALVPVKVTGTIAKAGSSNRKATQKGKRL